jgi:hypothetical protein
VTCTPTKEHGTEEIVAGPEIRAGIVLECQAFLQNNLHRFRSFILRLNTGLPLPLSQGGQ